MADVELLPLPESDERVFVGRDSAEGYEWATAGKVYYTPDQTRDYARACVEHHTAAQAAEIDALRAEVERCRTEATEVANGAAVVVQKAEARAERLDAEVSALREALDWTVRQNDELLNEGRELTARAGRLSEALRETREYVTSALQAQREAFAGHEDCSDIPGIEADLHKIDALLPKQEEGR